MVLTLFLHNHAEASNKQMLLTSSFSWLIHDIYREYATKHAFDLELTLLIGKL